MSTKKTIFLTDQSVNFIKLTSQIEGDGVTWTNAINAGLEQLQYLIGNALPSLTIKEWETILNCYAGCFQPAFGIPAWIASDLMDNVGAKNLDETEPGYRVLVEKCAGMTQAEQMAVLYFVQAFWSDDWKHCADFDEVVKQIADKLTIKGSHNDH